MSEICFDGNYPHARENDPRSTHAEPTTDYLAFREESDRMFIGPPVLAPHQNQTQPIKVEPSRTTE